MTLSCGALLGQAMVGQLAGHSGSANQLCHSRSFKSQAKHWPRRVLKHCVTAFRLGIAILASLHPIAREILVYSLGSAGLGTAPMQAAGYRSLC